VRASLLAARLVGLRPGARLTLVMETWQQSRLAQTAAGHALAAAGVRVVDGVMTQAPRWPHQGGHDLLGWRDALAASGAVADAELVISDNLAGVLALRPDAVLVGSFLWSDVLAPLAEGDPEVARFCADERALLAAHRPPMICVDALAMPGVRAQSRALGVPFMAERVTGTDDPQAPVAVLGGASGAANQALAELARHLAEHGVPLCLAAEVAAQPEAPVAPRFDHDDPQAYGRVRAVICRPGVGTITFALAAGRPIGCVLGDADLAHAEMAHNARALLALGVGALVDRTSVLDWLAEAAPRAAERAAAQPMGGQGAAAHLLAEAFDRRLAAAAAVAKEPS
jgi:hypothetical protein